MLATWHHILFPVVDVDNRIELELDVVLFAHIGNPEQSIRVFPSLPHPIFLFIPRLKESQEIYLQGCARQVFHFQSVYHAQDTNYATQQSCEAVLGRSVEYEIQDRKPEIMFFNMEWEYDPYKDQPEIFHVHMTP
jgi:hypothetical protein